jgi:hypothetical protein
MGWMSQNQRPQGTRATVYWTPEQYKMGQFYANTCAATAMTQDRLAFQDIYHLGSCLPTKKGCHDSGWDIGIPSPSGYSTVDLVNPEDIIAAALTNLTALDSKMRAGLEHMRGGVFLGPQADIFDAVAMSVLKISSAVDRMETAAIPQARLRRRSVRASSSLSCVGYSSLSPS